LTLPRDSQRLVSTYATSILMGLRSEKDQVFTFDWNRPYMTFDYESESIKRLPKNFKLSKDMYDFPDGEVRMPLYHLHKLGDGRDGIISLVATSDTPTRVMVTKTYFSTIPLDAIKREVKIWRNVWGVKGVKQYVVRKPETDSVGDRIVCMPFVYPVEEGNIEAVEEAASTMAKRGYLHNDLKWDHVKILKHNGKSKAIFIDFVDVAEIEDPEEAFHQMTKWANKKRRK